MDVLPYIETLSSLKDKRYNFDNYWQESAEYFIPRKAYITRTKSDGQRLKEDLFDTTGRRALQIFAAGMMGNLTSSSAKWFRLRPESRDLLDNLDVRAWFDEVENKMFDVMNNSNFKSQMMNAYTNFGAFGVSTMYIEPDAKNKIRYSSRPVQECWLMENENGEIDTIYREVSMTVRQAFDKWGKDSGEEITKKWNDEKYTDVVKIVHVVEPRHVRNDRSKLATDMPFASIYFNPNDKHVISEGGYNYFPFPTARLSKECGQAYGYGVCMASLPDMKELNKWHYTFTRSAAKMVDPVLLVLDDGVVLPSSAGPGSVVHAQQHGGTQSNGNPVVPIQTGGRIDIGKDMLQMKQEDINKSFFVDLFLMLSTLGQQMTAEEVRERVGEKMTILGPILIPLTDELLDATVENTFLELYDQGIFPEPPQALLENGNFTIEYVSPLAIAQRKVTQREVLEFLGILEGIGQIDPSVYDGVNVDETRDLLADLNNIPAKIRRSEENIEAIREGRAQQAEQQAQLEQAQLGAQALKTGAEAQKISEEVPA